MLHDVRIDVVSGSVMASRAVGALSDPLPAHPIADAYFHRGNEGEWAGRGQSAPDDLR